MFLMSVTTNVSHSLSICFCRHGLYGKCLFAFVRTQIFQGLTPPCSPPSVDLALMTSTPVQPDMRSPKQFTQSRVRSPKRNLGLLLTGDTDGQMSRPVKRRKRTSQPQREAFDQEYVIFYRFAAYSPHLCDNLYRGFVLRVSDDKSRDPPTHSFYGWSAIDTLDMSNVQNQQMVAVMEYNNTRSVGYLSSEADPDKKHILPDLLQLKRMSSHFYTSSGGCGKSGRWHLCPECEKSGSLPCSEANRIPFGLKCAKCGETFRKKDRFVRHVRHCFVIDWTAATEEQKDEYPQAEALFRKGTNHVARVVKDK